MNSKKTLHKEDDLVPDEPAQVRVDGPGGDEEKEENETKGDMGKKTEKIEKERLKVSP